MDVCDGCGPSGDFSGIQDSRNLRAHRGPADHDMPHRFVFSGIWQLPFGPRRAFLTSGPLSLIFGNWDVTGIVTFSSGIPFTPALNFDNANTGNTSRPDRIRSGKLDNWTVDRYFDIDAFVFPPTVYVRELRQEHLVWAGNEYGELWPAP